MIIYGLNPVLEAVRSHPDRIRFIAVSRDHGAKFQKLVQEAKDAGVRVQQVPPSQLAKIAGGGVHNGVIADVGETAYVDFDELIEREETTFVLILDGITDPQNLGTILRVADGFGVDLVVLPEHDSAPVTAAAVKASAGASEWVRVTQVTNLARAIEALKAREFWVYGAAPEGDAPAKIDFRGRVALVLGNEGKGVRRNVQEHCDRLVTIPMQGHVDSFNVATAAAILCYEVRRQTSE